MRWRDTSVTGSALRVVRTIPHLAVFAVQVTAYLKSVGMDVPIIAPHDGTEMVRHINMGEIKPIAEQLASAASKGCRVVTQAKLDAICASAAAMVPEDARPAGLKKDPMGAAFVSLLLFMGSIHPGKMKLRIGTGGVEALTASERGVGADPRFGLLIADAKVRCGFVLFLAPCPRLSAYWYLRECV